MKRFLYILICVIVLPCYADNNTMTFFPIENYSQDIHQWLSPSEPDYHKNLLDKSYQQKRFTELKHTYFGTEPQDNAVWSAAYVTYVLEKNPDLQQSIRGMLDRFDNRQQADKTLVYGPNYRQYPSAWIQDIQKSIDISSLHALHYSSNNRAIATENLPLRLLPTDDPAYYSAHIAGEGYPFDNLQSSAVYVGTPLYILGQTRNKSWTLVITPECIAWMKSNGVARVDEHFISRWQTAAYAHLMGIRQSNVSVLDTEGHYRFSAYVGMIFPLSHRYRGTSEILIPVKDTAGRAIIEKGFLSSDAIVPLPWTASRAHFAALFKTLAGREYAWGSKDFYTDCSSEMKSIFTLFGIFMPRNTQSQTQAGYMIDISSLIPKERARYLMEKGVPLLTLVRLKGHIALYVGTYKNKKGQEYPLSYQQVWGFGVQKNSYRAIIGQSVFLPLLTTYPSDPQLIPHLQKEIFQLIYLDRWPKTPLKQTLSL